MKPKFVTDVETLIDELGGTKIAAEKLMTTQQNVSNWKAAKKLPTAKYLVQKARLRELGIEAPPELWFAA